MSNLRRLSDHIVAPLLRALATIPRRPEGRLYLRRAVPPRMHMTKEDYRVFRFRMIGDLRNDEKVGDVYLDPKPDGPAEQMTPWKWAINTTWGGDEQTAWWAHGRARTLEEAMDAFRNAWDSHQPKKSAS